MPWFVYILECSDYSYYVGHTENVASRLKAHNYGKGALYTRLRRPLTLVYQEQVNSKQAAIKREQQIKRWSKAKKEALIGGDYQALKILSKCRSNHGKTEQTVS